MKDLIPCLLFFGEGPSDVNGETAVGGFEGLRPMVFDAVCRHAPNSLPEVWLRDFAESVWTPESLREKSDRIGRSELKRPKERLPFNTARKGAEKALYEIANQAWLLGKAALYRGADYAVFFHDCDRFSLSDMAAAVRRGAAASGFGGVVVMTPCPTSEAWILAGLKNQRGEPEERITPEKAAKFEALLQGNDRNERSAKAQLAQWVTKNPAAMALSPTQYRTCVETLDLEHGWECVECLPSMLVFVQSIAETSKTLKA